MADPNSSRAHHAKCCDICGYNGACRGLITCSKCKYSREHYYCMRILPLEPPKDWLCENCDPGKGKAFKDPVANTSQRPHKRPSQSDVFPSLRRLNHISGLKFANYSKTKLLPDKDAIVLAKGATNPHFTDSRTIKRDRPFAYRKNVVAPKESSQSSNCLKGSDVSCGVVIQQAPVQFKRTKIPSPTASWSGSLRVMYGSQHLQDIRIFQAHPPSRVHKKVYEFSKSMPCVLQFELIPRSRIWVNIDHHLCGDNRDIGLYFFPIHKKRWDNYDSLLELMQTKDYAMSDRVKGMELLIFASTVLRINYQKWRGRDFLWGLFRKVKREAPPQQAPPPKRKAPEH